MEKLAAADVEMNAVEEEEELPMINPLIHDRVYMALQDSCVILEEFTMVPAIRQNNG